MVKAQGAQCPAMSIVPAPGRVVPGAAYPLPSRQPHARAKFVTGVCPAAAAVVVSALVQVNATITSGKRQKTNQPHDDASGMSVC